MTQREGRETVRHLMIKEKTLVLIVDSRQPHLDDLVIVNVPFLLGLRCRKIQFPLLKDEVQSNRSFPEIM